MSERLIKEIASNLGMEEDDVSRVLDEFLLQIHRRFYEYRGMNGDYLGEELHRQLGAQGFYHLLGFLETFSSRYDWEPGIANEYLLRLGNKADWMPFKHQMVGWRENRRKSWEDENESG